MGRGPHVEPVASAGGHADQVTPLTQGHVHFPRRSQIKHSGAFHEEAYFIFVMSMLVEELSAQCLAVRVIRQTT